ncbi:Histidine ammonia-lyase-like protein [Oopsacas minuta]|uniref:Histidine ammonia-lyase n=1 Tax=Oopsacas minuta TaxID=111878 RepID=A0AAV7JTJ6_9METZ|nr:Histidine ammonia-lyase-like protein [Oopsacas minuta]
MHFENSPEHVDNKYDSLQVEQSNKQEAEIKIGKISTSLNILFYSKGKDKPKLETVILKSLEDDISVKNAIHFAYGLSNEKIETLDISHLASGDKLDLSASLTNFDTIILREKTKNESEFIKIDGNTLSISELVSLSDFEKKIALFPEVRTRIDLARNYLEYRIEQGDTIYGVNTGFGRLASTRIPHEKIKQLQENLILSHSAGVGPDLSMKHTRMMFALRINVLAKGYSGISFSLLQHLVEIFNDGIIPRIPEQGTAGASGDLAPLAHLSHALMGNGELWSPVTGWGEARDVLSANKLTPITLMFKEGLCLINGTQFISSLGAEAVCRAKLLCQQADVIAALTLEAYSGSKVPFSSCLHKIRAHKGQGKCAQRLRALLHSDLHPSEICKLHANCGKVQDPYSLRCIPQVHGIVADTIDFVSGIIETEINSATDNPNVFPEQNEILSGGNFHGEYPAKVLDYLAIAVHELASISERRIEQLINPYLSDLPGFLVKESGLNSGFMIAHVTASSLVSENKVLCHPSSIDSITTSAGQEDHVSMGGTSARKALKVIDNVEYVLAIELLAACQGIDLVRPNRTNLPLESVHKLVRSSIPFYDVDRYMAADINKCRDILRDGTIWKLIEPFIDNYIETVEGENV